MSTETPRRAPLALKLKARRELPPPAARRALREAGGVSQQDVARAVGVTRQCISWWESGQRVPAGRNLAGYVRVLDEIRRALIDAEAA